MLPGFYSGSCYAWLLILMLNLGSASAQSDSQDTLAQYLFPSFTKNKILIKNGTSYTLMINYNIITENVVFIQKGSYLDLANPETVDTAYFGERKFIPREKYFLEVLLSGKATFFIRNRGEPVAPPRPAGYGTTSELTSSDVLKGVNTPQGYYNFKLPEGNKVKPASSYWVRIGENWTRFYSENQLLKAFPGKEKELKQFIKSNRLKITRREDLIRIGLYCNSLLSDK